jgi:FKBP-type peptidyl-prolyl cis-trans isomerase
MRQLALVAVLGTAVLAAACEKPPVPPPSPAALATDEQKTVYALGAALGRNLTPLGLTAEELELVKRGLGDSARGASLEADPAAFGPKVQAFAQGRLAAAAAAEKDKARPFLDQAAREPGAERLPNGTIYRESKAGKGPSPKAADAVRAHYHGTLMDGTVFDSSVQRKEPATFALNQVVPCWTEAVQLMKVGGKSRIVCPPDLAYGDRGSPPRIRPGATLVFEVELLEIVK